MFLILNDFGIAIDIQVINQDCTAVDLTSATVVEMEFTKPDGTISTQTATVIGVPTEGRIRHTLASGFLDTVGTWQVRGKITEGSAKVYRTEKLSFAVKN
jgi:hypothetical protein